MLLASINFWNLTNIFDGWTFETLWMSLSQTVSQSVHLSDRPSINLIVILSFSLISTTRFETCVMIFINSLSVHRSVSSEVGRVPQKNWCSREKKLYVKNVAAFCPLPQQHEFHEPVSTTEIRMFYYHVLKKTIEHLSLSFIYELYKVINTISSDHQPSNWILWSMCKNGRYMLIDFSRKIVKDWFKTCENYVPYRIYYNSPNINMFTNHLVPYVYPTTALWYGVSRNWAFVCNVLKEKR